MSTEILGTWAHREKTINMSRVSRVQRTRMRPHAQRGTPLRDSVSILPLASLTQFAPTYSSHTGIFVLNLMHDCPSIPESYMHPCHLKTSKSSTVF